MLCCNSANAAFVLNGTRFIYDGGMKSISIEVKNQSDKTYGGQVWIENTDAKGIYMIPSPSFFKIEGKERQLIRIMKVGAELPQNRESLFWINVQEVPPKPSKDDGNVLAIAMNTQVKLLYRPKSVLDKRKSAEEKIQVVHIDGKTYLKNPTPYYFAIVRIKNNGSIVQFPPETMEKLSRFLPLSDVNLGKKLTGKISIDAIDDWGGIQTYELTRLE